MIWAHMFRVIAAAVLVPWCLTLAQAQTAENSDGDAPAAGKLNIASWGGAYTQSQEIAYFEPFKKETGIDLEVETHDGRVGPFDDGDGSSLDGWDVVDIGFSDIEVACRSGVLEVIEPEALAAAKDGTSVRDDFLPRTLHRCGVPSVAWSAIVVYDTRAFDGRKPKSASDFFDLKKYPGKRALYKDPRYVLELALLADGVEPGEVYAQLVTEQGLGRALNKLGSIRDDIIWTNNRFEPLELLGQQKVAMATAFSGRVFETIVAKNQPFGIIWDGQIYELDVWAIPKSSKNKEAALKFISFATRPDRLAEQTKWFPYGPVRKSALAMVGKHANVDIEMAPYLPTTPENFSGALKFDGSFWDSQEKRLAKRFTAWLEGESGETPSAEAPKPKTPKAESPKAEARRAEAPKEKPSGDGIKPPNKPDRSALNTADRKKPARRTP